MFSAVSSGSTSGAPTLRVDDLVRLGGGKRGQIFSYGRVVRLEADLASMDMSAPPNLILDDFTFQGSGSVVVRRLPDTIWGTMEVRPDL